MAISNAVSLSGRKYLSDFKSDSLPTVVYLHGSGQRGTDLEKIKQTPFYKLWYAVFKDDFNFFFPLQSATFAGWENSIGGYPSGAHFVREMITLHTLTKVIVTGHSAGGTGETLAFLQSQIRGFAPCSGRALSYSRIKQCGALDIPVLIHHGTLDTAKPNMYSAGVQMKNWLIEGGGEPEFVSLTGVGHGSDSYAYKPTSRLKAWIDEIFEDEVVPPTTGIFIDGVYKGATECDFAGLHIEYRS